MKIKLTSVIVDDQNNARRFYTEVLGFVVKHDIPMGAANWLTVISPEGHDDVELLLEPAGIDAAKTYQAALFAQNIPIAAFAVDSVQREYEKLRAKGVAFRTQPTPMGPTTIAVFEDTCGNLIQIYEG